MAATDSQQPEATARVEDYDDAEKEDSCYTQVVCAPKSSVDKFLCVLHWVIVVGLLLFILLWIVPKYLGAAVLEWANKIRMTLTGVQIGVVCTAAIWILTMCFIPSQPFALLAAVVFNFGVAFLITEIGTTLGFVCAFFLGRTVLSKTAMRLAHKYDGTRAVLMAVDRLGPFKVVFLLRFGPLPYSFVSYVSSVPDNIPFWSYFFASFLALAPRNAAVVWLGSSFANISDLFAGKTSNGWSLVFNIGGVVVALVIVIGGIIYCRGIMHQLEKEFKESQRHNRDVECALEQPAKKDDSALSLSAQAASPKKSDTDTAVETEEKYIRDQQQ